MKNSNSKNLQNIEIKRLFDLYQSGDLKKSYEIAKLSISKFPEFHFGWKILALINQKNNNYNEALFQIKKAIKLMPEDYECLNIEGLLYFNLNSFHESILSFEKAISLKINYSEAYNNLGVVYDSLNDYENSHNFYIKAINADSKFAQPFNNIGKIFKKINKLDESLKYFKKAIDLNKFVPEFYNNLGLSYYLLDNLEEAIKNFKLSISCDSNFYKSYNNLGNIYKELNNIELAKSYYEKSLIIRPSFAEAHRNLSLIKNYKNEDSQVEQILSFYYSDQLLDIDKVHYCFALGKVYEDLKIYKKSFDFLDEGNSINKRLTKYDHNKLNKYISTILSNYSNLPVLNKKVNHYPSPIFIVGMPRSGTTLVEQIVSSHKAIYGAGELFYIEKYGKKVAIGLEKPTLENIYKFRLNYLNKVNDLSENHKLVTDKMPFNFLYLGLILKSIPNAKVIYINRDIKATSWSIYKNFFTSSQMNFSYDLKDIINYSNEQKKLMKFWINEFSSRIHELDYERLIANSEIEIKTLINFIGIEWDQNCLLPQNNLRRVNTTSSTQVREKINDKSIDKWKLYEKFLKEKNNKIF